MNKASLPKIIYETPDFLAVLKPAGLLTHEIAGKKDEKTLSHWVASRYPETKVVGDKPSERPGIVHRLDKDTSGIIIIARTNTFFYYFKKLLQNREVKKTYLGLILGKLSKKTEVLKPIGLISGSVKHSTKSKKMKMIKDAKTILEPIKTFNYKGHLFTLVKITPLTGRTHQIRVHAASIGLPVAGDSLYGPKSNILGLSRHFLHANAIEFQTVDGGRIKLESDLPPDLQNALTTLENKGTI